MASSPTRRGSCPSRLPSLVCKIPVALLGLSETNTIGYQGKAIGENPISPVAPAIANAIYDAVGVRIQDLPITAEKVRFASHP